MSGGSLSDRLQDRPFLKGLRDERRLPESMGQIGWMRGRHKGKGDLPFYESLRDPEAFAADHVDIEEGIVESVPEMLVGIAERFEYSDDLMPFVFEDRL